MIKVIEITVIVSVVTSVATTLLMQILFQKIKNSNNKKLKNQSYQSSPKRIADNEVIKPPNSTVKKQPIANITSPSENSTHIEKAQYKQQDQKNLRSKLDAPKDRKAQIPQQIAISKIVHPPQNIEFTYFAVADGKFVVASIGQVSYYRSWKMNGQCYYQFYCDESRLNKAINNHSSVIDPFCIKSYDSVDFDVACCIETDECGLLDENNNIKKKTILNIR